MNRYLIIGLIINVILLFSSCKDDFYDQYGQFYFVNETNYNITYNLWLEKFNVAPKSTTIYEEKTRGEGKKSETSNFDSPIKYIGSDLKIKFNNVKCLVNIKQEDINSVKEIKNFNAERISNNAFKFTYTFTEADYNRAIICH